VIVVIGLNLPGSFSSMKAQSLDFVIYLGWTAMVNISTFADVNDYRSWL